MSFIFDIIIIKSNISSYGLHPEKYFVLSKIQKVSLFRGRKTKAVYNSNPEHLYYISANQRNRQCGGQLLVAAPCDGRR